jgi:hypothetical protein
MDIFKEIKYGPKEDNDSFYNAQASYVASSMTESLSDSEKLSNKTYKSHRNQKKLEENDDLINFNLADGSKVYFHNIRKNYFTRTCGYSELSLRTILRFIWVYFDSNISFLIALLIIMQ